MAIATTLQLFLILFITSQAEDFCKFDENHVMCNASGITDIDEHTVSYTYPTNEKERNSILSAFNKVREKIALGKFKKGETYLPEAANLMKLKWCDDCEKAAWNKLRNCKFSRPNVCCDCMNTGQLIIWYFNMDLNGIEIKNQFCIESILEEIIESKKPIRESCFRNVTFECFSSEFKFLTLASDQTTDIGCAFTVCKDAPHDQTFLCYFNFQLNKIINFPLYKTGRHCSRCRRHSKCTARSKVLCECDKSERCHEKSPPIGNNCPKDNDNVDSSISSIDKETDSNNGSKIEVDIIADRAEYNGTVASKIHGNDTVDRNIEEKDSLKKENDTLYGSHDRNINDRGNGIISNTSHVFFERNDTNLGIHIGNETIESINTKNNSDLHLPSLVNSSLSLKNISFGIETNDILAGSKISSLNSTVNGTNVNCNATVLADGNETIGYVITRNNSDFDLPNLVNSSIKLNNISFGTEKNCTLAGCKIGSLNNTVNKPNRNCSTIVLNDGNETIGYNNSDLDIAYLVNNSMSLENISSELERNDTLSDGKIINLNNTDNATNVSCNHTADFDAENEDLDAPRTKNSTVSSSINNNDNFGEIDISNNTLYSTHNNYDENYTATVNINGTDSDQNNSDATTLGKENNIYYSSNNDRFPNIAGNTEGYEATDENENEKIAFPFVGADVDIVESIRGKTFGRTNVNMDSGFVVDGGSSFRNVESAKTFNSRKHAISIDSRGFNKNSKDSTEEAYKISNGAFKWLNGPRGYKLIDINRDSAARSDRVFAYESGDDVRNTKIHESSSDISDSSIRVDHRSSTGSKTRGGTVVRFDSRSGLNVKNKTSSSNIRKNGNLEVVNSENTYGYRGKENTLKIDPSLGHSYDSKHEGRESYYSSDRNPYYSVYPTPSSINSNRDYISNERALENLRKFFSIRDDDKDSTDGRLQNKKW